MLIRRGDDSGGRSGGYCGRPAGGGIVGGNGGQGAPSVRRMLESALRANSSGSKGGRTVIGSPHDPGTVALLACGFLRCSLTSERVGDERSAGQDLFSHY